MLRLSDESEGDGFVVRHMSAATVAAARFNLCDNFNQQRAEQRAFNQSNRC
jgi:hypothetical protein